jgi:pentose-5-phosphate-3-epimerase
MENLMFDYRSLGEELAVPPEIVQQFEQEAHKEFPFDNMLMEIHVLRAVKTYAKTTGRMISIED